jgi:hypothetical protein
MDMNEIAALFHIHKEASSHGPAFKNIKDATWEQLKKIDAEHAAKPDPSTQETPAEMHPEEPEEVTHEESTEEEASHDETPARRF